MEVYAIRDKPQKSLCILLVEDDDDDVRLTRRALLRSGLVDAEVLRADRVGAINAQLKIRAPDLVLLDLTLPDCTGLDTLAQVRRLFDDTPIIVQTSIDDERLGIEALRIGAEDYVRKGTDDMARLDRTVRYALERQLFRQRDREEELYDAGTGLPGRTIFIDRLTMAIRRADQRNSVLAVALVRCDALTAVVDRHGKLAGEVFERAFLKRLTHGLDLTDSLASLGEGQYACIVESIDAPDEIERVRRTLGATFAAPVRIPTLRAGLLEFTPGPALIGLVTYPADGRTVQHLLAEAISRLAPVEQPTD